MTLDRKLLFYFARDALAPYSEGFRINDRTNPIELNLNDRQYSIHISYVHNSGENRANDDEVRIQIGRALIETQRNRHKSGTRVAFVGFFENGKPSLAGIHATYSHLKRYVWSPQFMLVSLKKDRRKINQASVHKFDAKLLDEENFAIALPSTALSDFLS